MAAVVVTSVGTVINAPGWGQQRHHFYAANTAAWWLFTYKSASATTLYAYYSTDDGATWNTPTNPTFTMADNNQGNGVDLSLTYANISSTDVVHFTFFNPATTDSWSHLRATLSGTTVTWGTEVAGDSHSNFGANERMQEGVAVGSDGFVYTWSCVSASPSHGGDFYVARSNNADTGSAWTTGFAAGTLIFNASNFIGVVAFRALSTGGKVIALGDNGASAGSGSNVAYSLWGGASWSPTSESDVFATNVSIGVNDWGWCIVSDTDVHCVRRNDATSTFTHRRWNGTSWGAGSAIGNHTCKANGGLAMVSDGTTVWLFIIDSAAGNTIYYNTWTVAGGWAGWTSFESASHVRTCMTAYYSSSRGLIMASWTQTNGSNFDLVIETLSISVNTNMSFADTITITDSDAGDRGATLTEILALTDPAAGGRAVTLAEALAFTESMTESPGNVLAEALAIAEAAFASRDATSTDTLTLATASVLTAAGTESDAVTLAESSTEAPGIVLTEPLLLTEMLGALDMAMPFLESLLLTENSVTDQALSAVLDVFTLTESSAGEAGAVLTEPLVLSTLEALALAITLQDTLLADDPAVGTPGIVQPESLGLTDLVAAFDQGMLLLDLLTSLDLLIWANVGAFSLADAISVADTAVQAGGVVQSEAMTNADSAQLDQALVQADILAILAAIITSSQLLESDSIPPDDPITFSLAMTLTDRLTALDPVVLLSTVFLTFLDALTALDPLVLSGTAAFLEALTATESVVQAPGLVISDGPGLVDSKPSTDMSIVLDDLISTFDAVFFGGLSTLALADAISILESLGTIETGAVLAELPTLAESAQLTDAATFSEPVLTLLDQAVQEAGLVHTTTLSFTELVAMTRGLAASDGITLAEQVVQAAALVISELLNGMDLTLLMAEGLIPSDPLVFQDPLAISLSSRFADALGLLDTSVSSTLIAALETLSLTEQSAASRTIAALLESLTLLEQARMDTSMTAAEALTLDDILNWFGLIISTLTAEEDLTISDARAMRLEAMLTDNLPALDTLRASLSLAAQESMALTDLAFITQLSQQFLVLEDALALTDADTEAQQVALADLLAMIELPLLSESLASAQDTLTITELSTLILLLAQRQAVATLFLRELPPTTQFGIGGQGRVTFSYD